MQADSIENVKQLELTPFFGIQTLLSFHFAQLYAAVERWREWKFSDPEIDALLAEPIVADLKGHRHATFHVTTFDDHRITVLIANDELLLNWSERLLAVMKRFLRELHTDSSEGVLRETFEEHGFEVE